MNLLSSFADMMVVKPRIKLSVLGILLLGFSNYASADDVFTWNELTRKLDTRDCISATMKTVLGLEDVTIAWARPVEEALAKRAFRLPTTETRVPKGGVRLWYQRMETPLGRTEAGNSSRIQQLGEFESLRETGADIRLVDMETPYVRVEGERVILAIPKNARNSDLVAARAEFDSWKSLYDQGIRKGLDSTTAASRAQSNLRTVRGRHRSSMNRIRREVQYRLREVMKGIQGDDVLTWRAPNNLDAPIEELYNFHEFVWMSIQPNLEAVKAIDGLLDFIKRKRLGHYKSLVKRLRRDRAAHVRALSIELDSYQNAWFRHQIDMLIQAKKLKSEDADAAFRARALVLQEVDGNPASLMMTAYEHKYGRSIDDEIVRDVWEEWRRQAYRGKSKPVHPELARYYREFYESTLEVETSLSDDVLQTLITTEDGKIGTVLKEGMKVPPSILVAFESDPEFGSLYKALGEKVSFVRNLEWDNLTVQQKRDVLNIATRDLDFWKDRKIPGLKIREELTFVAKQDFKLGDGTVIKAGDPASFTIRAKESRVEMASEFQEGRLSSVEFHVRGTYPADSLVTQYNQVLKGIGVKDAGYHVHMVHPIPRTWIQLDPLYFPAAATERHLRMELYAQLSTVMEGSPILRVKSSDVGVAFDPIRAEGVDKAYNLYRRTGLTTDSLRRKEVFGYVNITGGEEVLDSPWLMSAEYRALSSEDDLEKVAPFLRKAHLQLVSSGLSIDSAKFFRWFRERLGYKIKKPWKVSTIERQTQHVMRVLRESWYMQDWERIRTGIPPRLQEWVDLEIDGILSNLNAYKNNEEVKLLLFDWGQSYWTFENPALLERIEFAQAVAIRFLSQNPDEPVRAAQRFIRESGLIGFLEGSFGVAP